MPIKPVQEFGAAYSNAATSEYPSGSYKDETVPLVSRDGSPLVAVTENDRLGFDEALFAEVGLTMQNVPDTATSSQRLTAHKRLIDQAVINRQMNFDNVDEMLSYGVDVGRYATSGSTLWYRVGNASGDVTDFEPKSDLYIVDFLPSGYVSGGEYTAELQQGIDLAAGKVKAVLPDFPVKILLDIGYEHQGLIIPSNSHIVNPIGGELFIEATDYPRYEIVSIRDVNDVCIEKLLVTGDKYVHTGTSGEWGMCVAIRGDCTNIRLMECTSNDAWGDGFYVGQISETIQSTPKNVLMYRPATNRCRRQGMSVTSVDGLDLIEPVFYDTKSSDSSTTLAGGPHAGIDFEPNVFESSLRGINITGMRGGGNDAGLFYLYLGLFDTPNDEKYHVDINVTSISDEGSRNAAQFIGLKEGNNYSGAITIQSIHSDKAKANGISCRNWIADAGLPINIDYASVNNWDTDNQATTRSKTPVVVYQSGNDAFPEVGNFFINKLDLASTVATSSSILWVENGANGNASEIYIGLGQVKTNINTPNMTVLTGGTVVNRGRVGSKITTPITTSTTIDMSFSRDYVITNPVSTPTVTLPEAVKEGANIRFKFEGGSTATDFRLRSLLSTMVVNNQVSNNTLFEALSGDISVSVRGGVYFVDVEGVYTVES